MLGETSGLLRVIESEQGDDQQTSRADLILPAELAIAAVRDRHHEPGLIHAEPGPHIREGSIGAVVCPSHEAANRPAPTAYGRRGGTTKGLLPVGSDHHGSVAIHPGTEENKTHSAVRAPFDDPTGADRGRRGPRSADLHRGGLRHRLRPGVQATGRANPRFYRPAGHGPGLSACGSLPLPLMLQPMDRKSNGLVKPPPPGGTPRARSSLSSQAWLIIL